MLEFVNIGKLKTKIVITFIYIAPISKIFTLTDL